MRILLFVLLLALSGASAACNTCDEGLRVTVEDLRGGEPLDFQLVITKDAGGKASNCTIPLEMNTSNTDYTKLADFCQVIVYVQSLKKFIIEVNPPNLPTKMNLEIKQAGKVLLSKTYTPDYSSSGATGPNGSTCQIYEDSIKIN